jgi:phosphoribosylanthranilate isomerase
MRRHLTLASTRRAAVDCMTCTPTWVAEHLVIRPLTKGNGRLMRVKICGIRSEKDLELAVDSGADALGFICGTTHFSEDVLEPEVALALVKRTPPYVSTVLVTHLESAREICELADRLGVDTIQVHGLVSTEVVAEVYRNARGRCITRALHVTGEESLSAALNLVGVCDAVHLDSRTDDRLGGTGLTHDWSVSRRIRDELRRHSMPVILAGGLRPENLHEAWMTIKPYAVDVNSGVETSNGDKDPERLRSFMAVASAALRGKP